MEFRNRCVFSMLFNALCPPPLLPPPSILNTFFYAFSRFISALAARTEAERNLNISRLEAVFFMLYEKFNLVVHQRRSPLHPMNVQGGVSISPRVCGYLQTRGFTYSLSIYRHEQINNHNCKILSVTRKRLAKSIIECYNIHAI